VNKLFRYAVMLDSPVVAYIQFMIMLIELQKVLSHELKCLCSKTIPVQLEWTVPKIMDVSYIFIAL